MSATRLPACVAATLLALLVGAPASAQDAEGGARSPADPDPRGNVFHDGSALPWGEPSDGVRFLPLYGTDYSAAGRPFAFRLHVQPGFELGPHTHPVTEHITILSGTLFVGLGEAMDREAATPYGPGSYLAIGADVPAFMWSEEATIVQVHGVGPFATQFVESPGERDAPEPRGRPARPGT